MTKEQSNPFHVMYRNEFLKGFNREELKLDSIVLGFQPKKTYKWEPDNKGDVKIIKEQVRELMNG